MQILEIIGWWFFILASIALVLGIVSVYNPKLSNILLLKFENFYYKIATMIAYIVVAFVVFYVVMTRVSQVNPEFGKNVICFFISTC